MLRSVQGVPEVSTGCIRDQYRVYQRSVQGVPEVSTGCTRNTGRIVEIIGSTTSLYI